MGVLDKYLNPILPTEYSDIYVDSNEIAIYATSDGRRRKYDWKGRVTDDFVVYDTKQLYYELPKENGDIVMAPAPVYAYYIRECGYGLLSAEGKPITKAIYSHISAVNDNLYECSYDCGDAIYLDARGNRINE